MAGVGVLCAGLFYGYGLIPLGFRIPCPFRQITGLRCPGCGITDLCLAVLHGRFLQAPGYNWGLVAVLPLLVGMLIVHRHCPAALHRKRTETVLGAVAVMMLLVWGVCRNIWGI